jgi:hypothetical protein
MEEGLCFPQLWLERKYTKLAAWGCCILTLADIELRVPALHFWFLKNSWEVSFL